jgi:hypothetical protein
VFDFSRDEEVECDAVLLARVRENDGFFPEGVERTIIRPDGKMIVTAWARLLRG